MRYVPHPRAAAPCLQRVRPNDTPHTSHASEPPGAAAAACGAHVWLGVQGTTGNMRKRTQSQGESRQKTWTCPVEGCESGPCRKDKLYSKGGEAAPWPGAKVVNRLRANRESVQIGSVQLGLAESSVIAIKKKVVGKHRDKRNYYRRTSRNAGSKP